MGAGPGPKIVDGKVVPQYKPYGPEWETAMMELSKENIIPMLRNKGQRLEELHKQKAQLVEALKADDVTLHQKLISELMDERDKAAEALKDVQVILWGANPDTQKALDIATEGLKL